MNSQLDPEHDPDYEEESGDSNSEDCGSSLKRQKAIRDWTEKHLTSESKGSVHHS